MHPNVTPPPSAAPPATADNSAISKREKTLATYPPSLAIQKMPLQSRSASEATAMQPDTPIPPAAKLAAGNLLTDTEVAALYGCAVATLRNMRWRGEGPRFVRLGGRMIRYKPADVQAFIDGKADAA